MPELVNRDTAQRFAKIVGPGDDQGAHLVDGAGAVTSSGASDQAQRPDRFDTAGACLGLRDGFAGLRGTRSSDSRSRKLTE